VGSKIRCHSADVGGILATQIVAHTRAVYLVAPRYDKGFFSGIL